MAIDYTKRTPSGKITLTKAKPAVSLTKQGNSTGLLRVNLNWNSRPAKPGGGLFSRRPAGIDLDLGCLYEFTDGSKGVVQALGNSFTASPAGVRDKVIWLDGDDRSGANSAGENLFIDLGHAAKIRRVMVFALIYEGAPNWAQADGVVTLYPASGAQIEVRLDESRDGARICGIAMLEQTADGLSVRREVNYLNGGQSRLDQAYGWGLRWTPGHK
jgi:tellurite resistance protein TerA